MGPYLITRVGKLGEVEIKDPKDGVRKTVNGHRLKLFLLENKDDGSVEVSVSLLVSIPTYEAV